MRMHVNKSIELFPPLVPGRVYLETFSEQEDSAADLVLDVLGEEARSVLRDTARTFPLRCGGTYFSISHSANIVALAVADQPVGVDIETNIPAVALADLRWALTSSEVEESLGSTSRLTEIWTAKEAAVKVLGTGLISPPNLIATTPQFDGSQIRTIDVLEGAHLLESVGHWLGYQHVRISWQRHELSPVQDQAHPFQ